MVGYDDQGAFQPSPVGLRYDAWLRSRAEWHGKMAVYSLENGITEPGGLMAEYWETQAYEHATCACHFAALVGIRAGWVS